MSPFPPPSAPFSALRSGNLPPNLEPDDRTEDEKEEDRQWDELLASPHPDWIRRIAEQVCLNQKLSALGFESVGALLKAHPNRSEYELARSLFDPPIPPILLHRQYALDSVKNDTAREYVMEMLVRGLRHHLPKGWIHRPGEPLVLKTTHAMGTIDTDLRMAGGTIADREAAGRAWEALLQLAPPIGWLPEDIHDPLIQKAFNTGWPSRAHEVGNLGEEKGHH